MKKISFVEQEAMRIAGAEACAGCSARWVYSECDGFNVHQVCPGMKARCQALALIAGGKEK